LYQMAWIRIIASEVVVLTKWKLEYRQTNLTVLNESIYGRQTWFWFPPDISIQTHQNQATSFSFPKIFRCLIHWVSIVIKISLENKSVRSKKTNSIIDFNQIITPRSCFLAFLLVLPRFFLLFIIPCMKMRWKFTLH